MWHLAARWVWLGQDQEKEDRLHQRAAPGAGEGVPQQEVSQSVRTQPDRPQPAIVGGSGDRTNF